MAMEAQIEMIVAPAPSVEAAEVTGTVLREQGIDDPIDPELYQLDESEDLIETRDALVNIMEQYEVHPRRSRQEEIWIAVYKAYMGYKHPGVDYSIRETWREQETLEANLHDQILGTDPRFKLIPHGEGAESEAKAAAAGRLINFQIDNCDRGRGVDALRQHISNSSKYGNGITYMGWQTYREYPWKINKAHAQKGEKPVYEKASEEMPVECPIVEDIAPWDLYVNPYIEDVHAMPVVFWRQKVSVGYLKTRTRDGTLDKDVVEQACESDADTTVALLDNHPDQRANDEMTEMSPDGSGAHELLWCWTNDGWEYVIIDRKYLARGRHLQQKKMPIEVSRNNPQKGEFYGIPDPLITLDEQRIVNDLATQWLKGIRLTNYPMVTGDAQSKKSWQNALFQVGGFIEVPKGGNIQPLQLNPAINGMTSNIGFIMQNMQASSGITPELSGTGSSAKTATAHVRLENAASMRIKYKVKLLSKTFKGIYKMLYQLNQANITEDQVLRLVGSDGKTIPEKYGPSEFDQYCDVDIELGNVGETSMEKVSKWMQFGQVFGPMGTCDLLMVQDRVLRSMGEQRPQQFRAQPLDGRDDQMWELGQLPMGGLMPDPRPQDNHQQHLQVCQMFMASPAFMQLSEVGKASFQAHMMKHQAFYMQQMEAQQQQMQAQQQQQMSMGGPSPVESEANARTEAEFNNGQRGAEQQGAM